MKNKGTKIIIFLIAIGLIVYNIFSSNGAFSLITNEKNIKIETSSSKPKGKLVDSIGNEFIERTKNNKIAIVGLVVCGTILLILKKKRKKEEEFNKKL